MTEALRPPDIARLEFVHSEWLKAKAQKNYPRADRLRGYLERSGCMPPDYSKWHPVFEASAHRHRRIMEAQQ